MEQIPSRYVMMKVCKKCGIEKPLPDYKKYTAGKGGIRNVCVECERIRLRDWKRKNADKINEGRRERHANDTEYREKTLEYKKKYRTNNRERYLKLEREGSKRRYWENPDLREKLCRAAKNYRENMDEDQIKNSKETRFKHWIDNKERLVKYRTEWRHNRRKLCIERLGGKCVGYKKECGATEFLQFDHIKPSEKSFDISRKYTTDLETLFEELDKCQLLCRRCHMEKTKDDWLSGELYKGISEERDGTDSKQECDK